MAAEEFKHPVQGFQYTDHHHHNHESFRCPIALFQRFPAQEEDEESDQSEPFKEFDLGKKGKKTECSHW